MLPEMRTAESAIDRLIERGRKDGATSHERWVSYNLLNNVAFRHRLTERLARRVV